MVIKSLGTRVICSEYDHINASKIYNTSFHGVKNSPEGIARQSQPW